MIKSLMEPVMDGNCERCTVSKVAKKSLIMMNGEFVWQQAELLAARAMREAVPLSSDQLANLPEMPATLQSEWRYGYGEFDEPTQRVVNFTDLPHWTGSEWQGGAQRPDPTIGWVIANPNGGHTGACLISNT